MTSADRYRCDICGVHMFTWNERALALHKKHIREFDAQVQARCDAVTQSDSSSRQEHEDA